MLSLGIISWKESFHFLGELHLEVDGEPHGQGITFDREGFSKKKCRMGGKSEMVSSRALHP